MKNAYNKDILRSIKKNLKRFLAIVIITALGITVLTGIYAACMDMRNSADRFYDQQQLYDVRILSTLGLTSEDVDALQLLGEIDAAAGVYSETVYTQVGSQRQTAELSAINKKGINAPYLIDGSLPKKSGEIAVTQKYLDATQGQVGDPLFIEADNEFGRTDFTIVGVVIDPLNTSNEESGSAFRATAVTDYLFFVDETDVESEVYTSVFLTLHDTERLNCFSKEYEERVKTVVNKIESEIKKDREQGRYDHVFGDAQREIEDAQMEMNEEFEKADKEFADAWSDWEKGQNELVDGENTLKKEEVDANSKLAEARDEIVTGKAKLSDAEKELEAGTATLDKATEELQQNEQLFLTEQESAKAKFIQTEQLFVTKQAELDGAELDIQNGVAQLLPLFGEHWPQQNWEQLVSKAAAETVAQLTVNPDAQPNEQQIAAATAAEQEAIVTAVMQTGNEMAMQQVEPMIQSGVGLGIVRGSKQVLAEQQRGYLEQKQEAEEKLLESEQQLAAGKVEIQAGYQELEAARAEIDAGWADLETGEAKLLAEEQKAERELADAWLEIEDGQKELEEGRIELVEQEETYQREKEQAAEEIEDAYAELADIEMAQWYVQDRLANESYSGLKNDLASIETVGKAFPVIFLLVAVLISLTTMTRLVEEERGLIGTYKALGFSDVAIYKKYLSYALSASLFGGLLGDVLGFVVLPTFLLGVLKELYIIPQVNLYFDWRYGVGGILLFVVSIVGSVVLACRSELKQHPSVLMRPKSPRAGSRVLLERIPFIWKRLKFLHKVTARNLFRYKKRLLMTVIGIMGCTALVLAGFAIKDSVNGLMSKQYYETYHYDLMVVAQDKDNQKLVELLEQESAIEQFVNVQVDSVSVLNEMGESENVQLIVVPTGANLATYIGVCDGQRTEMPIENEGVLLTRNAAEILKLDNQDIITVQQLTLDQGEVKISQIVENYLGNNIYMTQELYESQFGEYQPNAAYVQLTGEASGHKQYAKKLMDEHDFILSSVSTQALREDFSSNFAMVNSVLYLLIVLAAGLAFVVLFTLSNTNISERERELATIKVLGFYDTEVHTYVNSETLILTVIGVVAGLPVGRLVSGLLTSALKMPGVYFAVSVKPISYVIAGAISFSFAVLVNIITNRTLNRINMVEALKSVE